MKSVDKSAVLLINPLVKSLTGTDRNGKNARLFYGNIPFKPKR